MSDDSVSTNYSDDDFESDYDDDFEDDFESTSADTGDGYALHALFLLCGRQCVKVCDVHRCVFVLRSSNANDLNLVMQEVGRFVHGEEEDVASVASESKHAAHAAGNSDGGQMEEIPMSRTGVGKLNAALRSRLIQGLGQETFDRVYRLLRDRATAGGGETRNLTKMISRAVRGDKSKMQLCFEVDVLIWQEDNYKGSTAKK